MIRVSKPRLLEPWRSRVLWLSLAANLFLAALAGAPHLMPRRPPGPPGFDGLVERMARQMPDTDADTFRHAMDRERPWYDISRRSLEEARAQIGRSIGQDPFDPVATRTAMTDMQDRLRESSQRFDESLVAALASLSPQARTSLSLDMARRRR